MTGPVVWLAVCVWNLHEKNEHRSGSERDSPNNPIGITAKRFVKREQCTFRQAGRNAIEPLTHRPLVAPVILAKSTAFKIVAPSFLSDSGLK